MLQYLEWMVLVGEDQPVNQSVMYMVSDGINIIDQNNDVRIHVIIIIGSSLLIKIKNPLIMWQHVALYFLNISEKTPFNSRNSNLWVMIIWG